MSQRLRVHLPAFTRFMFQVSGFKFRHGGAQPEACDLKLETLFPLLLCVAGGTPALRAADWPQWGGNDLGRNMVSSEKNLPDSFKPGTKTQTGVDIRTAENVRWAAKLGNYIYGNATIAGGKVFVGTDNTLLTDDPRFPRTKDDGSGMVQCLDEATGKLLWRLVVPKRPPDRLPKPCHYGEQKFGVCSSPAVDEGRVYVVTNACEVVCLSTDGLAGGNKGPYTDEGQYMVGPGKKPVELKPTDADILWVFDMIDQAGVCPHDATSCSPLVYGGFVYTATSNGVDTAHKKCTRPDAPSFIVLDAKTGRLVATDNEGLGHRLWHCLWSPPSMGVVNGQRLVFFGGADGVCYAFEAATKAEEKPFHLKKVWSYDCCPPNYRLRDGKPIDYYEGDARKNNAIYKAAAPGTYVGPCDIIGSPVFHEGRVYVAVGQDPAHKRGKGLLTCIDASKTGDTTKSGCVWTYDGIERTLGSVAISDGLLYAADLSGKLHCLEAATGKPLWVHESKLESWGTPLVADGKVFLGAGQFLLVMAAGREERPLGRISLGQPSYGTPVAANGTLYVASEKYLWAVQKKGAQSSAPNLMESQVPPAKSSAP